MDELIVFVGYPLAIVLMYFFIRAATGSKKRRKQLHLQNLILLHIAKKLDVDGKTIEELDILNNEIND